MGLVVACFAASALAQEEEAVADAAPAAETAAPATESAPVTEADAAGFDKKIMLGVRTGYSIPMGDAAKDAPLNDGVSGMIPLQLDLGYRVTPNIVVGGYFQYGFVMVKDCPDGADCSGNDLRFGVQGQYHLSPGESINPWFGVGLGYEILKNKAEAAGVEVTASSKGMEFLNLQGGADFAVADGIGVGPFVSLSLGQFSKAKIEGGGMEMDGDIEDKAMHQWLTIGVRGTFDF
jgi:outer membrane protein W